MKARIYSLFVTFWISCAMLAQLSAQPEDIISRTYSMNDGLSHDFVRCLFQDGQGFLWVGTSSGLNKFDGYHFITYQEDPSNTNSLTNNNVNCLWEDKQQRLWIGTTTGLELFDLKTEKFFHSVLDSLDPTRGFNIGVHKIREHKAGKVWICTFRGIYLADAETLSITRPIHFPQEIDGNNFWDLAEARDGSVWAASSDGLVHMDVHTGHTSRYRHDPGDPLSLADDAIRTVHVDRHDRVWVGTGHGLDLFNPEDQSFAHFLPLQLQSDKSRSSIFQLLALLEHPDGTFWIGFGDGLYAFDPESGKFDLLVDQYIWSILQDNQGSIWVGAVNGLFQIAPQSKKFTTYRQFGQTDVSDVRVLAEDANQHIWIAVYHPDYQLFQFDPSSRRFIEYLHDPLDPHSYSGNYINGIIPDNEGGVWLASYDKLEKFHPQHQTFSSIDLPNQPTDLFKDSRGRLWLGGWVDARIYDPQTETYERLTSFPRTKVNSILEDWEENIWAGTDQGLIRYSLKTGQLDVFKHDPTDPESLSHNRVLHLMIDREGTLWLGTNGGLNKMIPGTAKEVPKFIHWRTTYSGLPHDEVRYIIDGGDGTLWLGCGNMISHFFPQTSVFRNYDYRDGLPGQSIYKGLRSQSGEIYFGSRGGMVVFHPDSLQDNPYIPPVAITGFSIHNQPVPMQHSSGDTLSWKTPQAQAIPYTDAVELTYLQDNFSFEFTALNFVNPENNLYKYKLEPYETDWVETTASSRNARYTNISPGRYTFRVIGSNNDGLWNEEGRILNIIIHPPWWQTWWAYSLYGLLALGTLWSIRRYEIKRLKLRHRAEHLAELDSLKSRFFANISHEFRTPLTLILGPVKNLIEKQADRQDQDSLSGIQRNAQRLLHLVNQLLDLSKLEAGKLKLEAVKGDIVAFLKARAFAFSSLAEHKNIQFVVVLPEEKIGAYFDHDKLEKIINNLLSNAFKFTAEGGTVQVKMHSVTQDNKDWMQIQVKDSGKGVPPEEIDKIFDRFYQVDSSQTREQEGTGIGLALTNELVELHHGTIRVESTPGEGSTFTLLLPRGKDHLKEEDIIQELSLPEEETASDAASIHPSELLPHPQDNQPEKETEQITDKPVVLIVEDHQEVRKFICASINQQYEVKEAEQGVMGLKMARELLPDLIISDVMMPEMDGYALCEKIKTDELTSHIPVILLTAKADRQSKLAGLETGANDYLAKPFDAKELKLIIRNRIEERRKMQERFSKGTIFESWNISFTSLDEQFLKKVMEIIKIHLEEESFTIEVLSQEAGYSHMQFYRKIKALSGQTPSQFLRMVRLKRAAEMLQQKSDTVSQIAFKVGFNSLSYFNKCFKEQFGMTPGQFAADDQPIK